LCGARKAARPKSLETVIEIQAVHAKTAYESFMAKATKMGEIYMNLAQETSKSFENFIPKVPAAK
jgi:hypothetical protein